MFANWSFLATIWSTSYVNFSDQPKQKKQNFKNYSFRNRFRLIMVHSKLWRHPECSNLIHANVAARFVVTRRRHQQRRWRRRRSIVVARSVRLWATTMTTTTTTTTILFPLFKEEWSFVIAHALWTSTIQPNSNEQQNSKQQQQQRWQRPPIFAQICKPTVGKFHYTHYAYPFHYLGTHID